MSDTLTTESLSADLFETPLPERSSSKPASPPPLRVAPPGGGLPKSTILLAAAAIGSLLWGVWMTKEVADLKHRQVPIAAVRLQPLIEEYVQAQARSGTPEELVMRQTQAFMSVLDAELLKRGKDGTTVLVAEAVLSKNVPDITVQVRQAVYQKIPPPAAGGPQAMPPMQQMPPQGAAGMGGPQPMGGGNGQ